MPQEALIVTEGRAMRMADGDELLPKGPLTEEEILIARRLLRDYERSRWLKKQGKIWISWVIGAPVAIWGCWQALHAIVEYIARSMKG